jgi:hypothetical protein
MIARASDDHLEIPEHRPQRFIYHEFAVDWTKKVMELSGAG